ncbi:MAG: PAS domain S-box protein [Desulfobacteraceae bacterium]|nr:PAS domain S-box protein [Desulfobacteraceae bacterium]
MKIRTILIILASLSFISMSSGGYLYYSSLKESGLKEAHREAGSRTKIIADHIASNLSEYQKSVKALAGLRELKQLLASNDANNLEKANKILDHFKNVLDVSICYIMDHTGNTIASSNRNSPDSFVGKNYSFRPYFLQAIQGNPAIYMALGVTSGKRGVYFSHPIYGELDKTPLGVVVIKSSTGEIEKEIDQDYEGIMLFTDPHGVIFATNNKNWLYHVIWKVSSEEIAAIAKTRQFGTGPWNWTGLERIDGNSVIDRSGIKYKIHQAKIQNYQDWSVIYLHDTRSVLKRISEPLFKTSGLIILVLCLLIGLAVFFLYREASHDIVQRKRAEEALRESEERFRNVHDTAPLAFVVWDIATRVTEWNKKAEEVFGWTREEVVGNNFFDFLIPEKNRPHVEDIVNILLKGGLQSRSINDNLTKEGKIVICEWNNSLIHDKDGNIIGAISLGLDITDRKQMEKEKENFQTQLQRAQKMEAIGALAGGVAHDLNNILSGIVSYPDLLLADLPEGSPLRKPILTMQQSGQKAAVIVQDLLTLARRGVAVTEVINLNDITLEYLKSPEHKKLKFHHPAMRVETDFETNLLNILGSPVHLSKTVMNLISNSAEAMPDGGKILISTKNRYVDRPIKGYDGVEEGDYAILKISDTGIGINSEDIERIFEPFYTKKVMGRSGTGLGMAVVWGTVKDHNGYINVESVTGKTTFTLYFPVTREEIDDASLIPIESLMGNKESILLVDDVKEQREIASSLLTKLGYTVTTVSSGEEAVEYMKVNSADLLVLDMIMHPGIDGLDTYEEVLKLHPGQKAIIASGFSETHRVKKAHRLGAGQYIKKPYTMEKIGVAVRAELDK